MNWNEKSHEIAKNLNDSLDYKELGLNESHERLIINLLAKAAILGIEYDSFNWCNKVR